MTTKIKQLKNRNIPTLRFPGFFGKWEEKRLGDISEITSSKRIYLSDYVKFGIPFFRGKEISELKRNKTASDILYIKKSKFIELKNKFGVPLKNDILITSVGTLGNVYKVDLDYDFYFKDGNLIWLKNPALNSGFLEMALDLHKRDLLKGVIGSTQKALTIAGIKKVSMLFPLLLEQKKIASFLGVVDEWVDNLRGQKEGLEKYKKGMMQKIFSQEVRFKDENGNDFPEWEEKEIGDLVKNVGGTALEKFVSKKENYRFISIGNYSVDGKYVDNGQRIVLNEKTKIRLLNKGDLAMVLNDKTVSGDLIGSTILIDEDNKFIYNQRTERLICGNELDSFFAWYFLNSKKFRKRMVTISQGGTQIYVNFPSVKKEKIYIPQKKEQQKIAQFLKSLDNLIESKQQQITQAEKWKKGLMQGLFV